MPTHRHVLPFWMWVDFSNIHGCWPWVGHLNSWGYGRAWKDGRKQGAHRVAYEHFYGPIPYGLQIDHLCRNRRCVNPFHLEVVTSGENTRRGLSPSGQNGRKTHCKYGHEFTLENTVIVQGRRRCRQCERRRQHEKYLRRKARGCYASGRAA
jgi:hypothetical protein